MFLASRLGLQVVVLRVSGDTGLLGLVQGDGEPNAFVFPTLLPDDTPARRDLRPPSRRGCLTVEATTVVTREVRWSLVYEYEDILSGKDPRTGA